MLTCSYFKFVNHNDHMNVNTIYVLPEMDDILNYIKNAKTSVVKTHFILIL